MTASCNFYDETACDKNCSIDYHNTRCTQQQCSGGTDIEENLCKAKIKCFKVDSSCIIETPSKCSKHRHHFTAKNFCTINTDIYRVDCGNLHFKLLIDNKLNVCPSIQENTTLANCECKTCSGSSCSPEVATYCSCISPDGYHQSTTSSNIQSDSESSGTSALIGGVVGGFVALAFVSLLIFVVIWYRRKQSLRRARKGTSKAHENTEGGAKLPRGTGSIRMYEEISDTLNKEKQTTKLKPGITLAPGGYDSVFSPENSSRPEKVLMSVNGESDYNQLHEKTARDRNHGDNEQYDHVKDIRGLPENTEDYDHLNNFSKVGQNDSNDEYDHCKAVHPRQRGKIAVTPDDDYDHFA